MNQAENRTPLNGLRVIALRPAAELRRLRRQLTQAGGSLICAPVLRRALLLTAQTKQQLECAARSPMTLFTSRFAVAAANRQVALSKFCGVQLAVGAGTAAALRAVGGPDVRYPSTGANSESLLAMPELEQAKQIWLITGAGGRGLLDERLAARGCQVQRIDLYQRRPRRLPARQRDALLTLGGPLLLSVSSLDALEAWLADSALADVSRRWPVLAASARIAAAAEQKGLQIGAISASAQPDDLFAASLAYAKQSPFR